MRRFLLTLSIIVYLFPLSIKAEAIGSSTPTITTGAVTGNISACAGSPAASPNIQQFTVYGSSLTDSITVTAPNYFEVSLTPLSGYVGSLKLSPSVPTVVYVRSSDSAPTGSISDFVTLISAGAVPQTVPVSATINALPTVKGVPNQTVNTGGTTTPVSFTGSANTFTWVNGTPGIGLAPSGMGNIAAFTAINKGTTPVIDTFTVTPIHSALAYIVNDSSNTVSVINTGTDSVLKTINVGKYPIGVAVSTDGSKAYVTNNVSNTVSVINTTSNTVVATILVQINPQGIAVSPNGKYVYVVNQTSNTVSVIDTASNNVITNIPVGTIAYGITVSPDGSRVYVANSNDNTVSVINTTTNAVTATIPVGFNPVWVAESPNDSLLYVTNQGGKSVSVINTATNVVDTTISVGSAPTGITLSPDGSFLYVANSLSNTVSVIKTSNNSVLTTINVGTLPYGVSLNPDGSLLFVANEKSNNVSVINTLTNKVIDTITVGTRPYAFGNFITSDVSCTGPPVTFTITVTVPTIVAGKVTGNISACVGTASASPDIEQFAVTGSNLKGDITAKATPGFEVSLSRGSGYADSLKLTQSGGTVTDTVYVRSAASDPVGSISGTVTLTSFEAGTQTVAVSGTVNGLVIPSVSIKASADTICSGTAVTFTAKPNHGGTAPVYKWMVNGVAAPSDSATFSSSTLANGDTITCRLTSNATCATPADTISNSIIMNVTPSVRPSVSILASANNICAGTAVTFTATPTHGGIAPVYKWMVNNSPIAGADSATFSSSTLANGDTITCRLTSNATCATPADTTSNRITMIVNPLLTPSVSITASSSNICAGAMVTFTAAPANGGSAPVYQWTRNGANVGTNSTSFSSDSLANGDTITCKLTSNAACVTTAGATSNSITMIVNPYVSPSLSIAASSNPVCPGTTVTFTATPANGGSAPVYQWLVNNNPIAGADSAKFSSSTIVGGDVISCAMTSNSTCVTTANATSNSITMSISPPVSPSVSIAASANPICAGTAVTFTATPVNGGSAPVYQWQLNGADEGTGSGAYTSSTLANGDVISCIMTSNAACATPANATGNNITMNVSPPPVVNAGGDKTIDGAGPVILNATATGKVANITWIPATGLNNNKILNPVANPSSTTTYTIVVQTADGCLGTDSMTVKVLLPNITIPNTFTPNSDGINDRWDIKNLDAYPECTVMIYNRWGENVYSSIGYGVPWDGTYHGAALPVGVYYYIINRRDGLKVMSGYVTIIR